MRENRESLTLKDGEWTAKCGCAFHYWDGKPIPYPSDYSASGFEVGSIAMMGKISPHWHKCAQHVAPLSAADAPAPPEALLNDFEITKAVATRPDDDRVGYHSVAKAQVTKALAYAKSKEGTALNVLSDLYDLQNGSPLPKYQKAWERVMAQAQALLKDALQ